MARSGGRVATRLSRVVRMGEGSVVGGAVAQRLDPTIGRDLAASMQVIVVSGTNGKTSTTRLIDDALVASGHRTATNRTGANMANGIVGALMQSPAAELAVIETDEAVLPWALANLSPDAVVLLNLSRDQLDRTHEVSALARRWRTALLADPPRLLIGNADDPLVVYAAGDREVVWVAAGLRWTIDASTCPWCDGAIEFSSMGWCCGRCDRHRPATDVAVDGEGVAVRGVTHELVLAIPGRSARANAAVALAVVDQCGVPVEEALTAWRSIQSIEGRYQITTYAGAELRLHLSKNPAGWYDTLDLLADDDLPVILGLNARAEDGTDPSWIWDVSFDRLRGRTIVVLGERASDLVVRLAYADVASRQVSSLRRAVAITGPGPVHVVANYSAFQQLRVTVASDR